MVAPNQDPRAVLARHRMQEAEERRARQQLEAEAAQAEAQERAQREAEAQRAGLEQMRNDRIAREAYESMTEAQRAEFDSRTNPDRVVSELAQQARNQAIENFNKENAAQREREMQEWQTNTPSANKNATTRHQALQEINQRAAQRQAEFTQMIETRQLEAEKYSDPIQRAVHALPDTARTAVLDLANKRPNAAAVIEQIKQGSAQQEQADKQSELYTAFREEVKRTGARGLAWTHNIKKEFISRGLDPNYHP